MLPMMTLNYLALTTASPNALNATFAANVGADDAVVFGPGPLTISSAFTGPPAGPKDFDVLIPLDRTFPYDPSQGNLLLDVRVFDDG